MIRSEVSPAPAGRHHDRRVLAAAALPLIFAAIILIRGLPDVVRANNGSDGYPLDFQYLVDAGKLITSDHPDFLYQPPADLSKFVFAYGYSYPGNYAYAPTFAYAMSPLGDIDRVAAWDLWKAGVGISVAIVALATASAFRSWPWRIAVLAAALTWEPFLINARFGQSGALAAAILVAGVLVFLRDRLWGAALLGFTVFKPTVAIGPAIMLLSEKPKVIGAFCIVAALVALTPFLWLGADSFNGWIQTLVTRPIQEYFASSRLNQGLVSFVHLNGTSGKLVLSLGLLALVMGCHFVELKAGVEAAGALAVCGSLIANPHALVYDWGVAFAVILLLRRASKLPIWSTDLGAGALLILLFIAGDVSWRLATEDAGVRPLLFWAVGVMALILGTALLPQRFLPVTRPTPRLEASPSA